MAPAELAVVRPVRAYGDHRQLRDFGDVRPDARCGRDVEPQPRHRRDRVHVRVSHRDGAPGGGEKLPHRTRRVPETPLVRARLRRRRVGADELRRHGDGHGRRRFKRHGRASAASAETVTNAQRRSRRRGRRVRRHRRRAARVVRVSAVSVAVLSVRGGGRRRVRRFTHREVFPDRVWRRPDEHTVAGFRQSGRQPPVRLSCISRRPRVRFRRDVPPRRLSNDALFGGAERRD